MAAMSVTNHTVIHTCTASHIHDNYHKAAPERLLEAVHYHCSDIDQCASMIYEIYGRVGKAPWHIGLTTGVPGSRLSLNRRSVNSAVQLVGNVNTRAEATDFYILEHPPINLRCRNFYLDGVRSG